MSYRIGHLLLLSCLAAGNCLAQQAGTTLPGNSANGAATLRYRAESPRSFAQSGISLIPSDFAKLRLAPGFLVSLKILNDSDFDGSFRVTEQGELMLPEIGNVHVGGLTLPEARAEIQKKLVQNQILKNPQISLDIAEYTSPEISILGEVTNPGKYNLLVPTKFISVLAMAGGTTLFAGDQVVITHTNRESPQEVVHYSRASSPDDVADIMVVPGDTVDVMRAGIVYVLGDVNRPGGYVMQESGTLTLLQAIALANGTSRSAKTKEVFILRRKDDGSINYLSIPYHDIAHGRHADVRLRAVDVVYVPNNKIKSIFVNSQSIMTSAATAAVYSGILY
jgi:polysaccharide biosynthesis/export protein